MVQWEQLASCYISKLIGWFYEFIIVLLHLQLMVLVALCLLLSVSKPLKPGSMLKVNSKHGTDVWTPTESADARSVFGSIWTRSSMSRRQKTRRAEVESKRSVSWPGSNGSNERATLKCKESTEHRGKDLCIWRPALSGSYSLPLLTDAVCFSLCLTLPWKTNTGNHCALSPTALLRLHHGWATLC